jgi:excisionase family DNA binding protein
MTGRLAYRVPEVCKMLGISRATFYRRVGSGEIALRKLGGVSLVTRESLERLVDTMGAANELATD